MDADVLIIGAGPAGSACARVLAQAGLAVMLVDQHPAGRDKTCGDGLIPDAHQALARLGLLDAVMQRAQPVSHVGCIAPRGGRVDVPGSLAVLPRKELDALLLQAAQDAGANCYLVKPAKPAELVLTAALLLGDAAAAARAAAAQAPQGVTA